MPASPRTSSPTRPRAARVAALLLALAAVLPLAAGEAVTLLRTPAGGIQPQAAVDAGGTLHLLSFRGDPAGGDLWYQKRAAGETAFSPPLRVNSQANAAVAIGSVRGAHLALGRGGSVHVAWMGSGTATPKAAGGATPMLYTRLVAGATAFAEQRNVLQAAVGLDGGGSLAADAAGRVYVAWHATAGAKDDAGRAVFVARSEDDGATFAAEKPATAIPTGACACCGMRAFADAAGRIHLLYRGAVGNSERGMFLLSASDGKPFAGAELQGWTIKMCPMSTCAIAAGGGRTMVAWQTGEQVFTASLDPRSGKPSAPVPAPGTAKARKHPALAIDARGEQLLVWTEGTAWNRGGTLAWQRFDAAGKALGEPGRADGVPAWGTPTAVADPAGGFLIVY
jgi:hypothetical protein